MNHAVSLISRVRIKGNLIYKEKAPDKYLYAFASFHKKFEAGSFALIIKTGEIVKCQPYRSFPGT